MRGWAFRACVLGVGLGAMCSGPEPRRPVAKNLLLVSLDTLRADHVGVYGYARPVSPNLDRLARESLTLGRLRSHAPETRDSHMAVFTSQPTFVHRRVGALPTLAEQLSSMEFATAGFTDGGEVSHAFGFDRGFQIYADQGGGLDRHLRALEQWLDGQAGQRFFAFLHTYEIHDPYHPGEPYESIYNPGYQGQVKGAQTQPLLQAIRQIGPFRHGDRPIPVLDEEDRRQVVALYDGGLRKVDETIGRLYAMLERRGLLDSTLLVVMSDHGDEFWDHGTVLHSHTLYQELMCVLGLVRIPGGVMAGKIRWSPARGIDLAPTILELLGAPPLPSADGVALDLTVEATEEQPWYAEKRTNFALGLGRYKYIGELEVPAHEVYDLLEDPAERNPLKDDAVSQALLAEVGKVRGRIKENLKLFRELYPSRPQEPVDEQTLEQLRRLGYIE